MIAFHGCELNPKASSSHFLIIEDINIVDVVQGRVLPHQTVVIKDSLVQFIGGSWDQPMAETVSSIPGAGRYLIPGLWDMHFHLCWDPGNDTLLVPLLFSMGITGIRDMGGDIGILNQMKSKWKGDLGPEVFGAGPIVDGNPPVTYDFSVVVDSMTDIPFMLDSLFGEGADFIKTYSLIRSGELKKIAAHTKVRHKTFSGHLSEFVEPESAISLGQKSVEHLNRLEEIWHDDSLRLHGIAELMLKHRTWMCPTLIVYHLKAGMDQPEIFKPQYDRYIHPMLKEEWAINKTRRLENQSKFNAGHRKDQLEHQMGLVSYLHDKGIPILAGSDFGGMPYVYPGIGLHEELEYLVQAGLSTAEALATATINPAIFFSIEHLCGTVAPGKLADLVILNGNPLENIRNTREIHAVFRKGQIVFEEK